MSKAIAKAATLGISANLEYMLLNFVFSLALFLVLYVYWISPMDAGGLKFLFIFGLSFLTGIFGSLLARVVAANWKINYSIQGIVYSLLVSFFYACVMYFGIAGIIAGELTWERLLITAVLMKILVTASAYAIAEAFSHKIGKKVMNSIMGP